MVRYIIRRLLWVVVLLFLVSLITFVDLLHVCPSADPAQLRAGRQPNPELVEQIRAEPRARPARGTRSTATT